MAKLRLSIFTARSSASAVRRKAKKRTPPRRISRIAFPETIADVETDSKLNLGFLFAETGHCSFEVNSVPRARPIEDVAKAIRISRPHAGTRQTFRQKRRYSASANPIRHLRFC